MNPDEIFKFGKHRGKTLVWVLAHDLQYVAWLMKKKIKEFDDNIKDYVYENIEYWNSKSENCGGMDADWAAEVGCDYGMNVWGL